MAKIFLIKLKPYLVQEILNSVLQDMTHRFFFCDDSRGHIVYLGNTPTDFHALSIDWAVKEDDYDNTGFSISDKEWSDSLFISKYLQNILNEKNIVSNYMFRKIGNQKLLEIMKKYLLETIKIKGMPKKQRNILDIAFVSDEEFYRCVAILSSETVKGYPSINEADSRIGYTEGDIGLIKPIVIYTQE